MISVIIPTFNEAKTLPALLMYLNHIPFFESISEIIVSDGNSTDDTVAIAESYNAKIVRNSTAGRALQMNAGAKAATGTILYFLHADSLPPRDFVNEIKNRFYDGYQGGCFRLQFDHQHWFLRFNAWFTRFNTTWFRFADQSLFVTRDLFNSVGGFREDHMLLEYKDIIRRIKGEANFVVIPRYITTSARKYLENGIYRLQCIYYYIFALDSFGVSHGSIVRTYQNLLTGKL
ncbi:MAG TPA: TIGR04283 family arsenosugar biosynthesis glycosyltransferase [Ohtaekwangia sp.]|nr:TIGR04283 family arsenosugar biosynthesis glycosyltransferase [Ohtaekwangia sp.]